MLNGVGGEVDGADIVTVDEAGRIQRVVQLLQELPQPGGFGDSVGNNAVLGLGARSRNSGLSLGRP
jgi:hypothetical protein